MRVACAMHSCIFLPFPQENIFKLTNSQLRQREVGKELSASIVTPAPAVSTLAQFSIVPVFQACLECYLMGSPRVHGTFQFPCIFPDYD